MNDKYSPAGCFDQSTVMFNCVYREMEDDGFVSIVSTFPPFAR